jgi:hypothetical protein
MNLFDRILRRRADPTLNWGSLSPPIPELDVELMRFGTLQFGDGFDAAAFLGRPDRFEWTQKDYCELLYASGGFQIDYDKGRFAYLAFFIGPDDLLPSHAALRFSTPLLRGSTVDGVRLSSGTDRLLLERLFGKADLADTDPEEVILYYTRNGVTMEFEMDGNTRQLKRWNLYPKLCKPNQTVH